jgi:hypothetical protein
VVHVLIHAIGIHLQGGVDLTAEEPKVSAVTSAWISSIRISSSSARHVNCTKPGWARRPVITTAVVTSRRTNRTSYWRT